MPDETTFATEPPGADAFFLLDDFMSQPRALGAFGRLFVWLNPTTF
jgi:hypothetical protein